MGATSYYPFDDLRRFAVSLLSASGFPPARAAAFASYLLWFDAAGAASFGMATLPAWLDAIEEGRVDPTAEAAVVSERPANALLDAGKAPSPLVLERAGMLAREKAGETGVGLVRVRGWAPPDGPAAPVAADLAIGPEVGAIVGPGDAWTLSLPAPGGLPVVLDSRLIPDGRAPARTLVRLREEFWPVGLLAPSDGVLVTAVAVAAFGTLESYHERVRAAIGGREEVPGLILPAAWEARRKSAHERGVGLDPEPRDRLLRAAERLHLSPPAAILRPG